MLQGYIKLWRKTTMSNMYKSLEVYYVFKGKENKTQEARRWKRQKKLKK